MRLYASTYPRQVAGLVLVDATYELLRDLFTPEQLAAFVRFTLEPPAGLDPPLELFDVDASYDQMLAAKAAPAAAPDPAAGRPLPRAPAGAAPRCGVPPGFPDLATLERAWQTAQD